MKKSWKRLISVVLSVAMVFVLAAPAMAADSGASQGLTWEKVANDPDLVARMRGSKVAEETAPAYSDKDIVRASIVLDDPSTLDRGYSTKNIANNGSARQYRVALEAKQDQVSDLISAQALDGAALDVVWNLTLAANIISANVPYGKLEAIKAVSGVKDVFVETQYEPAVVSVGGNDPHMGTSSAMIGSNEAWANGYTGAGSLVAIVDTGLDLEHKSVDAGAFDYAISQLDSEVDLLTADEVAAVWDQLNAAGRIKSVDGVYRTTKVPYGVNYIDNDLDVTHINDSQGEHGSHVAGIAAANRFVPDGKGGYASALDTVATQGVAPDAQYLVMKVFGKRGGAYDSDYMAAIEDAIVIGADSVNLSLGSAMAGSSRNAAYQDILDSLVDSDTVVVMSSGNSGYWAEQTYYGYLYSDGANFATNGSPGSYTNTFTVASADNTGATGAFVTVDGTQVFYTETNGYGNAPLTSIVGDHEFIYIDGPGVDDNANVGAAGHDAFLDLGSEVVSGKIALCNRGSSSFFAKVNAAAAQGAVGVIIVNNTTGTINMNLSGITTKIPAVSITQADGELFKTGASEANGIAYYTGTVTVGDTIGTKVDPDAVPAMSTFSSWGVPGDLSLKPEITAPGGSIYAIWGANKGESSPTDRHDAYELMSGTSMAAPQVTGMAAVVGQYIRENGLDSQTGLSKRALAISLLMGTAVPMVDSESGSYYPVFQQGAGLANVGAAVNAHSYILMNSDATESYADGKVKVELGDDPDRAGSYSFGFTVNNLTDEDRYYDFSGEFFTQDIFDAGAGTMLDTWTAPLNATVEFTIDGEKYEPEDLPEVDFNGDGVFDPQDAVAILEYVVNGTALYDDTGADMNEDGEINTYDAYLALLGFTSAKATVPANGKIEVQVDVTLLDIANYDDNGAWVEGYVFVDEATTEDGAEGDALSIPVVGYYGSWSEPPMVDVGSSLEYEYELEDRPPYLYSVSGYGTDAQTYFVQYPGETTKYYFGFNPVDTYDDEFYPERVAINSSSALSARLTLIRNAAASRFSVTDEEGNILDEMELGSVIGSYYYVNGAAWQNTTSVVSLGYKPNFAEGTKVNFNLTFAPEYYVDGNTTDWDSVHENASFSIGAIIDNTAPVIDSIMAGYNATDKVSGINLKATDNQYVAGVVIFSEAEELLAYDGSQDQEAGAQVEYFVEVDLDANPHTLIQVMDYAGNISSYKLNTNTKELEAGATGITLSATDVNTVVGSSFKLTASVEPWGVDDTVVFSTDDASVAAVSTTDPVSGTNGIVVTGVSEGTATITVTSTANADVKATCEVTVKKINIDLNAVVWDEDGKVWFSEFNTGTLPDYTKLTEESTNATIDTVTYGADGNLYGADYDEEGFSALYSIDPKTFEVTEIGDEGVGYYDLAPSIAMPDQLMTIYGPYLIAVDPTDGTYTGIGFTFNNTRNIDGDVMVGIALVDWYEEDVLGTTVDMEEFAVLDNLGNIYLMQLCDFSNTRFAAWGFDYMVWDIVPWGKIGEPVDVDCWNSLYYDGQNLFWSRFNEADNKVNVIMVEDFHGEANIYDLGSFADGVWPVGGLFELDGPAITGDPRPMNRRFTQGNEEAIIERLQQYKTMMTSIDEVEDYASDSVASVQPKGGLNAVKTDTTVKPTAVNTSAEYTLELTADEDNNNGLYTVTYDDSLELVSATTTLTYAVINSDEVGKVTIGYADIDGVKEGDVILTLKFNFPDTTKEGRVDITNDELDEEKPGTTETIYLGVAPKNVTGVTVDPTEASVVVGETVELTATVEPEDADDPTVTWSSSDESIATVDENGVVTGVAEGEVTITVTTNDGEYTAEAVITVVPAEIPVTDISVEPTELELEVGEEETLTVTVEPEDATNQEVVFESSNEDVVTVDEDGNVVAVGPGTATITITAGDGTITVEVTITVKPTEPDIPPYIPYYPTPVTPSTPSTPTTPVTPVTPDPGPSDSGLPFVDVPKTSDLYDTIKFVFDKGLMAGVSDTEFDLYGNLTRGMIVSILYRNEGSPAVAYTGRFSDVAENAWYAAGVEWAASVGIAAGYEDGRFGPNDPVTREQLAAFLFRYANWKGYEIKTADIVAFDADQISEYALASVKWAAANGVLLITDGAIRPTELAKRWEIAVAIKAFLENVAK